MATVTRYVNTNSTAGGNGTTNATSGANRAYATLSEWESNEQTDLVTDGDVHVCICDGAGGDDSTFVLIDGWTTGSSNDITIQGTNGYAINGSQATFGILYINDNYVTCEDFDVTNTTASAGGYAVLSGGTDTTLTRMILDAGSASDASGALFANLRPICNTVLAINCGAVGIDHADWVDGTLNWCGAADCVVGLNRAGTNGTSVTANHCWAYNNSTADWAGTKWSGSYNASGDSTEKGTNAITTDLVSGDFVDASGDNFRIDGQDSTLYDAGISTGRPSTDLVGNSWSTDDVGPYAQVNYDLAANAGSYLYTGTAASTTADREIAAASGGYSYAGTANDLTAGRAIAAASGSYAASGTAAGLTADRALSADTGAYAVSGTDIALLRSRILAADTAGYSYAGTAADLLAGRAVLADAGNYNYSGAASDLLAALNLAADAGTYSYTGTDAALTYAAGNTLVADTGAYVVSGTAVSLLSDRQLSADTEAYLYSGTAAGLDRGLTLTADSGAYTYTGTAVAFGQTFVLSAETVAYGYSGTDAALIAVTGFSWLIQPDDTSAWSTQAGSVDNWAAQADAVTAWTIQPDTGGVWTEQ